MKTINKYLAMCFFASLAFISCDEDEKAYDALTYPNDSFVSLASSAITIAEATATPTDIVVNLATDAANAATARSITYTLSGTATKDVDFTIVDNKTEFAFTANTYQSMIQIIPIDNTNEDGDKEIIITLNDASGVSTGFPGPAGNGKSMTITLKDDDCAFVPSEFTGTPSGTETSSGSAGEQPSEAKFTLESSTASTATYKVENLLAPQFTTWGETVTTGGDYYITLDFTDPANPKVTAVDNGDPLGNGLAFFQSQTDNEWGYYMKLTSGSFSTCGKTLDLSFSVDITRASTSQVYMDDMTSVLKLQF